MSCLIDTGSMVSTITESCFLQHFEPLGREKLQSCQWLQLRAANGLPIPYIGYMEVDIVLCGRLVPGCGVLVVRDPPDGLRDQAPGVLGMNVLSRCYQGLFGQHGPALFDLPEVSEAPCFLSQALQECQAAAATSLGEDHGGRVRLRGRQSCRIPGGTMKFVPATCSGQFADQVVFFEPPESGLPAGLLAPSSLVQVVRGTVYVPMVNVGVIDVMLYPRSVIGTLIGAYVVSWPAGITEVPSMVATVNSQGVENGLGIQERIEAVDLSSLPVVGQGQVRALLHRFSSVFSSHDGDLGCTDLISHEIPLEDDTPVRQRHRRVPPTEYEVVKSHINQLLEARVIRESCSPYASPIVLVKKKDGGLRMCVDYRQLNAKTRKDAFPLPRIEETLDSLAGACWFSTLDLASGYNQVPVMERDRPKTAFCTPFGLFEWNRMPFGLCNAPSTFQRLMERLFGDQQYQSLLLYLDDVVVFSSSVAQHVDRLEVVLSRLEREGLKVKLSKCAFFQREVKYLGHVISAAGVSTDPGKIEAVEKWQRPGTVTELRSFLGFASYYRRFVEGFAKLAAPLHRLVAECTRVGPGKRAKQGLGEAWTEQSQASFEGLKRKLTTTPVLAYADFSLPFILEVDASHAGLGAVLSQEQEGRVRPVAYASRSLRPTERNMSNYSSMKLEFLALKWAMAEKFREYLLGNRCMVFTDNNPLSHLASAKLGATEQRWAAQLASFDFEVRYRSGRSNQNADALSRQNPTWSVEGEQLKVGSCIPALVRTATKVELTAPACLAAITALPGYVATDLHVLQKEDQDIQVVFRCWGQEAPLAGEEWQQLSRPSRILLRQKDRLVMRDGVLYRVVHAPRENGTVYTIAPRDDLGKIKRVHRSLLKVCLCRDPPLEDSFSDSLTGSLVIEQEELPGDEEEDLWVVVPHAPQVNTAPVSGTTPLGVGGSVTGQEGLTSSGLDGVGVTAGLGRPVVPVTALPSQSTGREGIDREVRRTTRATAGQHPNLHRLPRAVVAETGAPEVLGTTSSVSVMFRPWD